MARLRQQRLPSGLSTGWPLATAALIGAMGGAAFALVRYERVRRLRQATTTS